MRCQSCQSENPQQAKFCVECGKKLEIICPQCKTSNSPRFKFCSECGNSFIPVKETSDEISETESLPSEFTAEQSIPDIEPIAGERKHVTVLFSDLIGYTGISERLDPEDLKDLTTHIFDEVSKIVAKYDGFIEKFAGDAIMALFGAKKAHEDDPVRAIHAAREIHNVVNTLSSKYEEIIEQPLSMHSGINTGLVVTGDVNLKRGTHGVAGDTINVASRLSSLGNADEILVGPSTFRQAEGYFEFNELEPATVKGKSTPIQIFKVLSIKEKPAKIHRVHGLRADLIGRKVEVNQLADAAQSLFKEKKGSVISISGPAGTGKSRLIEEFQSSLNLEKVQWLEGHAYPYSQNIPYYPLIDLLNRALQIEEGDPPKIVKEKVEKGISSLIGEETNLIPYIGSLFSISYPEIDEVSPEFWKSQLQKAVQSILASLSQRASMIICIEDLHWADPSFLELIRLILSDLKYPILFLCTYRPIISLFTSHQVKNMMVPYNEIRLQDLSPTESQIMVESLLGTESIPADLQQFVRNNIEGNPFYIEEVINSLIESETLGNENGNWVLMRPIGQSDISSTIHGVISGRLDRLENETKRILQEASVIGRSFLYQILKRITELKDQIDKCLSGLERLDLIKTRTIHPDLEYIFKHALTQEVVYNGLLKKERQVLHERIGSVMEQLFQDRLPEFYETLAFHFARGLSLNKAINYLMKSGKKSLVRYSIEESNQYYKQAFELLDNKVNKTNDENELLIELLIEWAYVLYYRGYFKEMAEIFKSKKMIAESMEDKTKLGMFYSWYGWALFNQCKIADSYQWFEKALRIGEEEKEQHLIGYACTWLTWYYTASGKIDRAIEHGKRAQEISKVFKSDAYLYFKALGGLGFAYSVSEGKKKTLEIGNTLVDYGKKHSNIRSLTIGYGVMGAAYQFDNDLTAAIEAYEKAVQVGVEPFYVEFIRMNLALAYIMNGQIEEAENAINCVLEFSQGSGAWITGIPARVFYGAAMIAKGQMGAGLKRLEEGKQELLARGFMPYYLLCEYILAKVFSQIVEGAEPIKLSKIIKNMGFLAKNAPFASKKAEGHFKKVIELAEEMGAKIVLGSACLDLGLFYKAKKRMDEANKFISKAVKLFEQCEADVYLKQAHEALESLE